jgi:hypothetical protein
MKIITLNLWGGKLFEPLMQFVATQKDNADVFCFQDCLFGSDAGFSPIQGGRLNLFSELQTILIDFNAYTYRDPEESYFHGEMLPPDVGCGQVIFVRKTYQVLEQGGFRSHPESPYHKGGDLVSGRCQWVKIADTDSSFLTIMNLHGLWQRNSHKRDTPERLEQSQKIKEFFGSSTQKNILCGDFNVVHDGNAIALLEEDMVNLVKKYGVTSTRSEHYPKEEKFADYILTSRNIEVKDFGVLSDVVSDHLPLFLEI